MKWILAPREHFSIGCLLLVALAVDTGGASADARRPRRGAVIEELGAPSGRGYDEIILRLAPLVPSGQAAEAARAPAPPEPIAATPSAVATPVPAAQPAPAEKPVVPTPVFLREALPTIESASPEATAAAAPAVIAAPSATPISHEAAAEPEAVAPTTAEASSEPTADPEAVAPPIAAETSEVPVEAATETAVEPLEAEKAAPPAKAEKVEVPVAAESAPAARAAEQTSAEEPRQDGDWLLAFWQEIVAGLALAGLLGMKYAKRLRAEKRDAVEIAPAPSESVVSESVKRVAEATTARESRSSALKAACAAAHAKAPRLASAIANLRRRRKAERAETNEAPEAAKPKGADWTEIGAALRARLGGGANAEAEPEARANRPIALVDSNEANWEGGETETIRLLEPGDASAREIVMNARRRLRSAQN